VHHGCDGSRQAPIRVKRIGTIAPVGDQAAEAIDWVVGINNYVSDSGEANQVAAKWTAISVGLGAATTVMGAMLPLVLAWLMPR